MPKWLMGIFGGLHGAGKWHEEGECSLFSNFVLLRGELALELRLTSSRNPLLAERGERPGAGFSSQLNERQRTSDSSLSR